jgi:zinc protease
MRRAVRRLILSAMCLALAAPAFAQAVQWPSERPPRPTAPRPVKFPPYQVKTLTNGLQVIAVSHHEQPAITVRLLVRAGSTQDPADKPGVAALAAALLDQGTTTKTAEKIASAIDSIGGAMGAGSGSDLTFVNAAVMKDSLNVGLDLVADVVRNPSFAQEEIDRQRQQILSALTVSYDDPDYIAGVVFDRLVYGFNAYGKPDSGTPASIASITRADLTAFHKRWFGANNAILAIVGDVTAEQAFAGAERAFGSWGRSDAVQTEPEGAPPPTRRVVVIDRPGAVQTEVRVGNIALPRKHPDYLALDMASKILGGEGGNRLHRVLRSERGLTYGAAATMVALRHSGHIVADTDTRSESTAEVLRLMVDEISRLQRQRVSERELEDAQAYLTGSFPLTIETPGAIALQVLNAVFYGLDLAELETYRERVNAITPDDIQRVARKYLHPDRLSIVLVGDASVFAKQLAGVGFDQIDRIPIAELDLSTVDLRRTGAASRPGGGPMAYRFAATDRRVGRGLQVPATPRAETVPELIARAVRAKGGADLLRSVKTIKAVASNKALAAPGGPIEFSSTTAIRYPGSFRVDADVPNGPLVQVFHAGDYWVQDPRGARPMPQPVADEMLASVQRDSVLMLLGLVDGKLSATRLPDATDGNRTWPVLEVKSGSMPAVTVTLDPSTALIARLRYLSAGGGATEETFSDYRDVKGLKVAFVAVMSRDKAPFLERVVRSFEWNVPLDAGLFTRPS